MDDEQAAFATGSTSTRRPGWDSCPFTVFLPAENNDSNQLQIGKSGQSQRDAPFPGQPRVLPGPNGWERHLPRDDLHAAARRAHTLPSHIYISQYSGSLHAFMSPLHRFLPKTRTEYTFRLTSTLANSPQASRKRQLLGTNDFLSRCSPCPCRILGAAIPGQKESASGVGAHISARDTGM